MNNNNNNNNNSNPNRSSSSSSSFSFGFVIGPNGQFMTVDNNNNMNNFPPFMMGNNQNFPPSPFGNFFPPSAVPMNNRSSRTNPNNSSGMTSGEGIYSNDSSDSENHDIYSDFHHQPGSSSSSSYASSSQQPNYISPLLNLLNPNVQANNPFAQMLQQIMMHSVGDFHNGTGGMSMDDIAARLFAQHNHSSQHPTASSVINSLNEVEITDEDIKEKKACAVCMTDFTKGEKGVVELPCPGHHRFHKTDCLMPWLNQQNTCPVCRFELKSQDSEQNPNSMNNGTTSTSSTTTGTNRPRRRRSFMDVMLGRPANQTNDTNERPTSSGGTSTDSSSLNSDNELMEHIASIFGINELIPNQQQGSRRIPRGITINMNTNNNNDFDDAELQAALQASLEDNVVMDNGNHNNYNTNSLSNGTSTQPGSNNNNNTNKDDEYTQVLLSSLYSLNDTELQIQCADAHIHIDPQYANNREYLINALAKHNGVNINSQNISSNQNSSTTMQPITNTITVSNGSSTTSNNNSNSIVKFNDIVRVPTEPPADHPDSCTLRIRLPDSTYVTRRFDIHDTVAQIAAWIMSIPEKRTLFTVNPNDNTPQMRLRLPVIPSLTTTSGTNTGITSSDNIDMSSNDSNSSQIKTVYDSSSWFIEIEYTNFGKRATLIAEPY